MLSGHISSALKVLKDVFKEPEVIQDRGSNVTTVTFTGYYYNGAAEIYIGNQYNFTDDLVSDQCDTKIGALDTSAANKT